MLGLGYPVLRRVDAVEFVSNEVGELRECDALARDTRFRAALLPLEPGAQIDAPPDAFLVVPDVYEPPERGLQGDTYIHVARSRP